MRVLRRLSLVIALLGALAVGFAARAAIIIVPGDVSIIGEEAFSGLNAAQGVVVPDTVTDIGANAFGDLTIYGLPGSRAEIYAQAAGREFKSMAISNASLSASAEWTPVGVPVTFTINADCEYPHLKYRFYASLDGWMVKDSGVVNTNSHTFTFSRSGDYTVWGCAINELTSALAELPSGYKVPEPIRFSVGEARVAVGEVLTLISDAETRDVVLSSGNTGIVQVSGRNIIGRALGSTAVTATVTSELGVFSELFPVEVIVPVESVSINAPVTKLEAGDTAQFSALVSPWDATYPEVTWSSTDSAVASVDERGLVTAHSLGACEIVAEAGGKRASAPVMCVVFVSDIALEVEGVLPQPLYTHNTFKLVAQVTPWNATDASVTWSSSDEAVAVVDETGVVTCVGAGSATIFCAAADGSLVSNSLEISVLQGVEQVLITGERTNINMNEFAILAAEVLPSTAGVRTVTWASSNDAIARVSENGVVTPVSLGSVIITATAHNGVFAEYPFSVAEPRVPTSLSLGSGTVYVEPGKSTQLTVSALPENSIENYTWSSSNTSVARVDAAGRVTGVASGSATIKVYSAANVNILASVRVVVLSNTRTLAMPARRTSISAISSNLLSINSIMTSANNELTQLLAEGKISQSELNDRKAVIAAGFQMYAFPWMTLNIQPYWKAANSEGGAKDFKPGIVYYGIPYNSTYTNNLRNYNVTKLLNENRFYKSSGSYYILNQNKLVDGMYCGNDCSSMVALAFGSRISTGVTWNTRKFFSDTNYFKNMTDPSNLRPGDIIVRDGRHVVFFLYYASSAKNQIVVLEQGGNEAGINTVSTGLYDLSYYTLNSYKGRRLKSWA